MSKTKKCFYKKQYFVFRYSLRNFVKLKSQACI